MPEPDDTPVAGPAPPGAVNTALPSGEMDTTTDVPEDTETPQKKRVHHAWVGAAEVPLSPARVPGIARARAITVETVTVIGIVDIYCATCRKSFSSATRNSDCDPTTVPRGGPERVGPRPDRAERPPDGLACTG